MELRNDTVIRRTQRDTGAIEIRPWRAIRPAIQTFSTIEFGDREYFDRFCARLAGGLQAWTHTHYYEVVTLP